MKAFKKHIFLFILILIGTYFCGATSVNADNIKWEGVTIECIYSDGGLYEYSYNDFTDKWVTNRYTYNLKGVDSSKSQTTSSIIYSETNLVVSGTVPQCKPKVVTSISTGEDSDDDEGATVTYVKFINAYDSEVFVNEEFGETWWDSFLWKTSKADQANNGTRQAYSLVSENYILTDDAGEPDDVYNYKRENKKAEGEVSQAVSKPDYITILEYGDVKLAQSKSKTNYLTSLSFPKPSIACFTNADPKSYSGNNSTVSYYFESTRIRYASTSNDCSSGFYRYVYNGVGNPNEGGDDGELCTKIMPNTAKDLATIIRWAQLLVPVLLIGFTAIDIGKIVMSGNIEEDLPKQKKKIITRFIIAIVFFFLPLILKILLDSVKIDSGTTEEEISAIQSIKCIIDMV